MDAPKRTATINTQCWCVLIGEDGQAFPCTNRTPGPDAPFCWDCDDRHPQYVSVVTVRTP